MRGLFVSLSAARVALLLLGCDRVIAQNPGSPQGKVASAFRAKYLLRQRTATANTPVLRDLRGLLPKLARLDLAFGGAMKSEIQRLKDDEGKQLSKLYLVRRKEEAVDGEIRVGNDEVIITLAPTIGNAENLFLDSISTTQLGGHSGFIDNRLLGENSAYWVDSSFVLITFYRNNLAVSVACRMPALRVPPGLSKQEQSKLLVSGVLGRREARLPAKCADLAISLDRELTR